jgi:hypothetical protein
VNETTENNDYIIETNPAEPGVKHLRSAAIKYMEGKLEGAILSFGLDEKQNAFCVAVGREGHMPDFYHIHRLDIEAMLLYIFAGEKEWMSHRMELILQARKKDGK